MQEQQNEKQITNYLIYGQQSSKIVTNIDRVDQSEQCIKFNFGQSYVRQDQNTSALFVDKYFPITKDDIDNLQAQLKEEIILKRLCRLYPQKHMPPLYPQFSTKVCLPKTASLPHCIYQIFMLDPTVFRKKIINTKISLNGKYQILVNYNGKYELQTMDDIIPVFKKNEEPIWGKYLLEPWQVILIKMWAKINEGYSNLINSNPFAFLEYFGQQNWKRFNLRSQGSYFINYYKDKINENSKILLKSKRSQINQNSGLASNRIAYQLMAIEEDKNLNLMLMVHTSFENSWTGNNSIFDKEVQMTDKIRERFKLCRTLLLNQKDFLNIFSYAYVTHTKASPPIYRSFHQFSNPSDFSKAKYFQIKFQKEGFFNFSIQQILSNIDNQQQQKPIGSSRINHNKYLRIKYILSRKIDASSQIDLQQQKKPNSKIDSLIRQSRKKFQQKYNQLEYDIYQMGNVPGQIKGNANFIQVIPGTYILRIKTQTISKKSNFVIAYSTDQFSEIKDFPMSNTQAYNFLSHSIISLSERLPPVKTFSKQKYENLVTADYTAQIGYAFMAIKVDKKCPYTVYIQTDSKLLHDQGYRLKNQYKNSKGKFKIELIGGQSKAIIFKRRKDKKQFIWPTQAFKLSLKK